MTAMPIMTTNRLLSSDFLDLVDAYLALFDGLSEEDARLWTEGVDQTPAENLASMIGWWQRALQVITNDRSAFAPLPGFAWDEKKAVELSFEDDFADLTLPEARARLREVAQSLAQALARMLAVRPDNTGDTPLPQWFSAFAAHRDALGLTDAPPDADPLPLFFLHFTRSKMRSLFTWKEAVGHVTREAPHALWWY